ncbi:MAG: hypothetical protein R3E87_09070 [Burkholderiaceae bacterium]
MQGAIKAGATIEELGEALGTAIAINAAGGAYVQSLYALQAYEQLKEGL